MFAKFINAIKSLFVKTQIQEPSPEVIEPVGPELPDASHLGRIRLGLIVGHERKSSGAELHKSQGSMSEYDYNSDLAKRIEKLADKKIVQVEIIHRDGIGILGACKKAKDLKCDVVIELHFNGFNGVVTGTSTLCSQEPRDRDLAQIVQKIMCQVFERKGNSRGVKVLSRGDRGALNVMSIEGIANCLVEPFFGDVESEALMAVQKKDEYALSLLAAVLLWGRRVGMIQ